MRRTPLHSPFSIFHSRRSAFSLIELLVVVGISAMLSAVAIGYSGVGKNEVALSVEATKVSQIILQAKSLSVSTYGNAEGSCAYGVVFSGASYSLFAYNPARLPNKGCPSAASVAGAGISSGDMEMYTDGTWNISPANGVVFDASGESDALSVVLFYPPTPTTLLSTDGKTFLAPAQTLKVYLKTVDGVASRAISVNPEGQVTFLKNIEGTAWNVVE